MRIRQKAAVIVVGALAGASALLLAGVPSRDDFIMTIAPSRVVALHADGTTWQSLRIDFSSAREPWLPLEAFPEGTDERLRAREDARARWHPGIDPIALTSAVYGALTRGRARGASTLAMQVARLAFPSLRLAPAPVRKVAEMALAVTLRLRWGARGIEEAWLNLVPLPGEAVGLPAAARVFFGVEASRLSLEEVDLLLSFAPRPGGARARAWAGTRRVQRDAELSRTGNALPEGVRQTPPHFLQSLREGRIPSVSAPRGGLVRTTVDASLQRDVEILARGELASLAGRNATDVAVMVVENDTSRVRAYVGNVASLDAEGLPWVDAAVARRQAGSTLKPFLYGLAFERRLLEPDTLLLDTPYERASPRGVYRPGNYDARFRGAVRASAALAGSLNIPALRVIDLVGKGPFAARLERLGIPVDGAAGYYGESLALGSLDVTLWNLVGAYAALGRGGDWRPLNISSETGAKGGDAATALEPEAARAVTRILASNALRSDTFGLSSPLTLPFPAAVKTGTSVDMRDNWCVGYTREFTVGVWVGNAAGEPMWGISGVEGAAPLWNDVLRRAMRDVARARELVTPEANKVTEGAHAASIELAPPSIARIDSPVEGTTFARDPGMPAGAQRLVVEASGVGVRLRIGDEFLEPSDVEDGRISALWIPWPGRHAVALEDNEGRLIDTVNIEVK